MSRIEATYIYTDDRDRPVLRKVRTRDKRFRMQAARLRNDRLYWKGDPGCVERWQPEWSVKALYHLPVLLDALKHGKPVFLVEGERDCEVATALWRRAATTNWQGAAKFTPEQAEWFVQYGKGNSRVNVLMDNDEPGHWAGWQRYSVLVGAGVAPKRIRLWRPGDAAHKDVADVAAAGLGLRAFVRVGPREVEDRAASYGAERATRYTYPTTNARRGRS